MGKTEGKLNKTIIMYNLIKVIIKSILMHNSSSNSSYKKGNINIKINTVNVLNNILNRPPLIKIVWEFKICSLIVDNANNLRI